MLHFSWSYVTPSKFWLILFKIIKVSLIQSYFREKYNISIAASFKKSALNQVNQEKEFCKWKKIECVVNQNSK